MLPSPRRLGGIMNCSPIQLVPPTILFGCSICPQRRSRDWTWLAGRPRELISEPGILLHVLQHKERRVLTRDHHPRTKLQQGAVHGMSLHNLHERRLLKVCRFGLCESLAHARSDLGEESVEHHLVVRRGANIGPDENPVLRHAREGAVDRYIQLLVSSTDKLARCVSCHATMPSDWRCAKLTSLALHEGIKLPHGLSVERCAIHHTFPYFQACKHTRWLLVDI
mmetsp:Transcript_62113/g.138380  ORF Transcript_62113/g.138380 Transcript_62113/m.138380 type:complete len:224 (-) Transcript_62113:268-939(-)